MSACYQGIRAVTRFSAFAARAGVAGPHQADRDLLERYLAACTASWPATPGNSGAASGS